MPREAFWLSPQDRLKVYASLAALAGILAVTVAFITVVAAFTYPSDATAGPLSRVYMGRVGEFEVGKPVEYAPGQFFLVKKPDGSFVALLARGTHQGCNVPWREDFVFYDPKTGQNKAGWFREPFDEKCHGSTWDAYGVRVFGPAPRNLDEFPVEIKGDKVYVRAVKQLLIRGDRD